MSAGRRTAALVALAAPALLVLGCAHAKSAGPPDPAADGPIVAELRVAGAYAVEESRILAGLATQKTGRWPWSEAHRLDPVTLELDRRRVETFYQREGYFDAKVTALRQERVGRDRVRVTIHVEEGLPTRVTTLEVAGIETLPPEAAARVSSELPLVPGGVLAALRYEETLGAVQRKLWDEGYARAEVTGEVDVYPDRQEARVRLTATPGPLHRYGAIRLEGLVALPEGPVRAAVRRTLPHRARFTPAAVRDAESRVQALQGFTGVRIGLDPPGEDGLSEVVVTAEEAPVHSIAAGGGVGVEQNRQQVLVRADYRNTNFLGGLRRLEWHNELALAFLPSFFSPNRIGLGGTSMFGLTQPEVLPATDVAGRLGYERVFRQAFQANALRAGVRFPHHPGRGRLLLPGYFLDNYFGVVGRTPTDAAVLPLEPRCPRPCRMAGLELTFTYDKRDSVLSPRRGWYLRADGMWSSRLLGGHFDLVRLEPELRGFLPLSDWAVLAARARVGAVFHYGDTAEVPVVARLFGGGDGGHRGFGAEQLSPIFQDTRGEFVPLGGTGLWLLSAETRLRLSDTWGVVLFADWGDVTAKVLDFGTGGAHVALGVGARYYTLAGPVRVDLAYRVNRRERRALDTLGTPDAGRFAFLSLFASVGESF